ncbi:nudix hydrolase 2-like, partial [Beta vulgaris subsp. vulgaris]|uniref:nudix hydrolase 2-like n=1 Tax=Beta vulgaris subsp. vulgaris TaxID=3555 RepID=UPI002548113C
GGTAGSAGGLIFTNASHHVTVGALVVNHKKEVLVVQEKNGMLRGKGVWKFPIGTINEVGFRYLIETKFVEMLTFREHHMAFFEKSDLFFVCLLPLSFNIQVQESEIEAAQVPCAMEVLL